MTAEAFSLGDVVCISGNKRARLTGMIGCVKHIVNGNGGSQIGIDFSENVDGNNLHGHCKDYQGMYFGRKEIKEYGIVKMEPIDVMLKKTWKKEWEPKLNKENLDEPVIILEE